MSFFFSSRRRHTRSLCDWSSDVCSSDLGVEPSLLPPGQEAVDKLLSVFELEKAVYELQYELDNRPDWVSIPVRSIAQLLRSEERRVGKEWRAWLCRGHRRKSTNGSRTRN